ncbi:hypothetical protein, variant [Aphanomyces astaci]|uniref:Uncharacterized protein n=2 Tax=Aphanomyces astaci TaxID=112090 RepID=W4GX07_APHAT|nr:hypothetical protein H257_04174 [Aphanomyces astaci]XP_009826878.1 hypothetical protein, variant [Aphanomyces astaci]ETV83447.1 hypothetical protein H257_04174 [Aphanomyces astaci]ETV83448.1 hypothetical protein, variant [Aphanomyces astaci]RHZ29498.1 hypothetical protein DYB37_008618 [Aphanomyces astaci]RQM27341.1 hypothetical protein B5M09_007786 [Aphanomyces astaci]|eukprot:XP_009826877.1 hypothetical protein H257_04174 [Aphanomyces astaci]
MNPPQQPGPLLPNTALFRATLPRPLTWQRPADLNNRIPLMQSIEGLLATTTSPLPTVGTALAGLARKLETYLYIESASYAEYANLQSLPRRVQALTAAIVNRNIRKRARPADFASSGMTSTSAPPSHFHAPLSHATPSSHTSTSLATLFSFAGGDIWHTLVWEYVGGLDTLRCRGVHRNAARLAPTYVKSLHLSCNTARALLSFGHAALSHCIHLEELEIYSLAAGITFGRRSMFARHCSQRFVVTHDDHEQIVSLLARQLLRRCWPVLRRLSIVCLFTNDQANGEADVLLHCLKQGVCPALTELSLPGNSFGDYGAIRVAELLQTMGCPQLSLLDLRRNFIGERGMQALARSLTQGSCVALSELCLGGNMLTDSSLAHLLVSMESRQVPQLTFLGLEMNYLTAQGIQQLGTSVGKLGCPRLTQISFGENSVDDDDAKKILNQAILIQRVKQKRAAAAHDVVQRRLVI